MNTVTRWDQSRGLPSLQEQVIRLFEDNSSRDRSGHADLATWVPPADIYETENELVIKADLPDLEDKDIVVHVEDNSLTINEDNHLRVERAYEWNGNVEANSPWENGYSKSFNSRMKPKFADREMFGFLLEAKVLGAQYKRYGNPERLHSGFGYKTPAEFPLGLSTEKSCKTGDPRQ